MPPEHSLKKLEITDGKTGESLAYDSFLETDDVDHGIFKTCIDHILTHRQYGIWSWNPYLVDSTAT